MTCLDSEETIRLEPLASATLTGWESEHALDLCLRFSSKTGPLSSNKWQETAALSDFPIA